MLRGCQKRVIHLRDTKSQLFDEAYFIIREQSDAQTSPTPHEMVKEAQRIIRQSLPEAELLRRQKMKLRVGLCLSFFFGVLFSWLCYVLFFI